MGGRGRAVLAEGVLNESLDLIFLQSSARRLHRFNMAFRCDVCGALHEFDLIIAFEKPQLVNDRAGVYDRFGRADSATFQCAHSPDSIDNCFVQRGVAVADAVVETVYAVEKISELLCKLAYGKRFVRAVLTLRAFDSGPSSVPDFPFRIARADKERVRLFLCRRDDG